MFDESCAAWGAGNRASSPNVAARSRRVQTATTRTVVATNDWGSGSYLLETVDRHLHPCAARRLMRVVDDSRGQRHTAAVIREAEGALGRDRIPESWINTLAQRLHEEARVSSCGSSTACSHHSLAVRSTGASCSKPPHRSHPGRIKWLSALHRRRGNNHLIEQRADNRTPPLQ